MKKKMVIKKVLCLIGVLFLLSVSVLADCFKEDIHRTEAYRDGDVNIYESGVAFVNGVKFYDFCPSEDVLVKYYCDNGSLDHIYFDCSVNNETCRSGVCTSNPQIDEIRWGTPITSMTEKDIQRLYKTLQEQDEAIRQEKKAIEEWQKALEERRGKTLSEEIEEVKQSKENIQSRDRWDPKLIIVVALLVAICGTMFFLELRRRSEKGERKEGESER